MRSSRRAITEIDRKGQGREFFAPALLSSMFVQKISEVAIEQGADGLLQGFCETLIREQTRVQDGLRTLARKRQVDFPVALDGERQAMVEELGRLEGRELEESYCRMLTECLQRMVDDSRKAGADAKDVEVQSLALLNHSSHMADLEKLQHIAASSSGR